MATPYYHLQAKQYLVVAEDVVLDLVDYVGSDAAASTCFASHPVELGDSLHVNDKKALAATPSKCCQRAGGVCEAKAMRGTTTTSTPGVAALTHLRQDFLDIFGSSHL